MRRLLAFFASVVVVSACRHDDERSEPPAECRVDADCADRDVDRDECTKAQCYNGRCETGLLASSPACQCLYPSDCRSYFRAAETCETFFCNAHQCSRALDPAGKSKAQQSGDCKTVMCDGTSAQPQTAITPDDLPKDSDPCTVETCTAEGEPKVTKLNNGDACGNDKICYEGRCIDCRKPQPASCKSEGAEPQNDSVSAASSYKESAPVCGHADGSDVDWWTFRAEDASLRNNVLRMTFWSSAQSLEACIYITCDDGSPPRGGCGDKKVAPNGSVGCCYSGSGKVEAEWDLECKTNEDSGTVYVSVRTPGATACETYVLTGSY